MIVEKLYAENMKLKAKIELQRKEIIAESARTAQEKLRADSLDRQHTMQAAMHKQANEEVVLLKRELEQRAELLSVFQAKIAPQAARTSAVPERCPLCRYQYGHAIGCNNNPIDVALAAAPKEACS